MLSTVPESALFASPVISHAIPPVGGAVYSPKPLCLLAGWVPLCSPEALVRSEI